MTIHISVTKKGNIKLEFLPGSHLIAVLQYAKQIAQLNNARVIFWFNACKYAVLPESDIMNDMLIYKQRS